MKSLLKPYIKKQVLLEKEASDNKEKENIEKLKGKMYTLVWEILNSKNITGGFADRLSQWIGKLRSDAGDAGDPPAGKSGNNLTSNEVRRMIQVGTGPPSTQWFAWDRNKTPPKPVSASSKDGLFGIGTSTSYNWGSAPAKATPGNAIGKYGSDSENYFTKINSYNSDLAKHSTNLAKQGSTGVDEPADHGKEVEAGKADAVAKGTEEKERANAEKKSIISAAFGREHKKTYEFIRTHFIKKSKFFDELNTYDKEQVELLAQIASQYKAIVNESLAFNLITEELTSDDLTKLKELTNKYFSKYGDGTPDKVMQIFVGFENELKKADKASDNEPPEDDKEGGVADYAEIGPGRMRDPKNATPRRTTPASLDRYEWKTWGKEDVAQQVANWSTGNESQQNALRREIKELFGIFGKGGLNRDFITGREAAKLRIDKDKLNAFKKVFLDIGAEEIEGDWWNTNEYAIRIINRDLLQGYLDGKNKLYFDLQGSGDSQRIFWRDEPSAAIISKASGKNFGRGGSTSDTVGAKGGLFSDDVDAEKYVTALLSYASAYPHKIKDFIKKQGAEMTPSKTIKFGDTKLPATIFMDGNYVNQIWKHWAIELDGTKETLPIWDGENKQWKKNKTGKTSADQTTQKIKRRTNGTLDPDILKALMQKNENIATTTMLLGVLGLVGGPIGAGFLNSLNAGAVSVNMTAKGIVSTALAAFGIKYGSLSQEQQVELAMLSTNYGYAMLEDMDRQIKGYRNAFKSALPFELPNLFKVVMEKNPKLTAGMLTDFRRTIRVPGTLMQVGGARATSGKLSAESIQQNPSFRSLIDITNILNEKPVVNMKTASELNQVSSFQLQNANRMLDAMGMSSSWRFIQPRENTEIPDEGLRLATTSVGTYRRIDSNGMVTINVTQRSFGDDPDKEVHTETETTLAPVPVEDIEGQLNSAISLAELVVKAQSDVAKKSNGGTMNPAVLLDAVQKKVVELGIDLSLSSDGTPVDPNTQFNAGKAVEAIFKDEDGPVYEFINNPEVQAKETLSQPAKNLPNVEVVKKSVIDQPEVVPSVEEEIDDDEGPQDDAEKSNRVVSKGNNVEVGDLGGQDDGGSEEDEAEDEGGDEEDDLGDGSGGKGGNVAGGGTFDDNLGGEDDDDDPTGTAKLTPEQITAIKTRLSDKSFGAGSRDPKMPWGLDLQQIFKIGPNGTKTDFNAKFEKVKAIVTNSTSPTPPEETLNDVGASIIPAGTRIKMYDDALKSGPGAEIMKQVTDSDPNFAKVWDRRKSKTFTFKQPVALFYYFGTPIQVATTQEEYVALTKKEDKPSVAEPESSEAKPETPAPTGEIDKKIKELLGSEQWALWQKFGGDLSDKEKGCILYMMQSQEKKLVASGGDVASGQNPPGKYSIKITQNPRGRNDTWPEVTNVIDPSGKVVKSWQAKNNREPAQISVAAQDYVNKMNAQAKESIETTGTILQENFGAKIATAGMAAAVKAFVIPLVDDIAKIGIATAVKNAKYVNTLGDVAKMMGKGATKEQAARFLRHAHKSGNLMKWTGVGNISHAGGKFMTSANAVAAKKAAQTAAQTAAKKAVNVVPQGKLAQVGSQLKGLGTSVSGKLGQKIKNNPKKFAVAGALGAGALAIWASKGADCDKDSLIAKMSAKGVGLG